MRLARSATAWRFQIGALGEAIWIYGTCRDRDAPLLPTVSTKLLEAAGFAALALAVAVAVAVAVADET